MLRIAFMATRLLFVNETVSRLVQMLRLCAAVSHHLAVLSFVGMGGWDT